MDTGVNFRVVLGNKSRSALHSSTNLSRERCGQRSSHAKDSQCQGLTRHVTGPKPLSNLRFTGSGSIYFVMAIRTSRQAVGYCSLAPVLLRKEDDS